MHDAPVPPAFEPDRFRSAAATYERGRVAYAPALLARVAAVTGIGADDRLLDLGCGPAPLARGFAPLVREVLAVDPSVDMLAEARTLAAGIGNIRFVEGSSRDLGPEFGRFRLVVMGRSFHWMDRVETLDRLDDLIEAGGAVALFHDSAPKIPANAWRTVWDEIRNRYGDGDGPHRDPKWIRHEAVLLASPFAHLEQFGVIERRALDIDTLIARTLSMSTTSPSRLGSRTNDLVAELRAALGEVREEVVETSALVAWRTPPLG